MSVLELNEAYEAASIEGVYIERPAALRLVRLTGSQRVWFLQNTVTADVESVGVGQWVESCFLNPKGRVLAHMRIAVFSDEVWLDVDPPATEELVEWFTKYRFRTKVEIETRLRRCFTIVGPIAAQRAGDGIAMLEDDVLVLGGALGAMPTADVHVDGGLPDVASLRQAPVELYDVLRVEAGIGAFGIDYGDRELPQEAGLTRTVSIDKGCYVGQETVARIHFRGHINRVLRPLRLDGVSVEDAAGRKLTTDGVAAGKITSAVGTPRGVAGIGMVRVEPDDGALLDVEGGGRAVLGPIPEGTKVKR